MNTQMQTRPSTRPAEALPTRLIRLYVTQLIRMAMVAVRVPPGHPWFNHQMIVLQAAAKSLKEKTGPSPSASVRRYVEMEGKARLQEFCVEAPLAAAIIHRLSKGILPLINTDRLF